jgi:hypothetical protein
VLERREGAPLTVLAQDAFGVDAVTGGANYQLARRTYRDHPKLFKTARRGGYVWVEPTPALCRRASLDQRRKHTAKTRDCDGVAMSNARAILKRHRTLDTAGERAALLGAFGAKRKATEDRYHAFQDTYDTESHLLVPYSTRFNSKRRVREARERYAAAWRRAAAEYDVGVVATLTTDPSRYDSLYAACADLLDDANRLRSWLAYDPGSGPSRPGFRPPAVVVPEFTESGLPHLHVAFFGIGWLTTHDSLSRYWADSRDRGEVVWFDRITERDGRWRWAGSADDCGHDAAKGRTPREYLREPVDLLETSVEATAAEVEDAASALRQAAAVGGPPEDAPRDKSARAHAERLSKTALMWATGLPAFTLSPSLKPNDYGESADASLAPDGTPLPADAPSRWRYLGTARYDQLPGYVTDGAVILSRDSGAVRGQPPPQET